MAGELSCVVADNCFSIWMMETWAYSLCKLIVLMISDFYKYILYKILKMQ